MEVEPVGRLRQPELLEEDLGELPVPVLSGVQHDLLDPGLAQRHRTGPDLMNCGRLPTTENTFTSLCARGYNGRRSGR